jgi:hypothetical protein
MPRPREGIVMTSRFVDPLLCGALLLLTVLRPATASAETIQCSPTKVIIKTSALDNSTTTSQTFVNIPETAIIFTQGGTSPSCVIVRFSAETFAAGNNAVNIRAYLGANVTVLPDEARYSGGDSVVGTHLFEFVFPSVAPGRHILQMQFRSSPGATDPSVFVHVHNTVVQYAP